MSTKNNEQNCRRVVWVPLQMFDRASPSSVELQVPKIYQWKIVCYEHVLSHLHGDVIWLQLTEFLSKLFSCAYLDQGYCLTNLRGILKFRKYKMNFNWHNHKNGPLSNTSPLLPRYTPGISPVIFPGEWGVWCKRHSQVW